MDATGVWEHGPAGVQEGHRQLLIEGLRRIFGEFNEEMLARVLQEFEWVQLAGGETLLAQGSRDDSLYLVISGRLRALRTDEEGHTRALGEIARGETVGELAFFTGEARTATVVAVRDAVLVRLRGDAFRELLIAYPLMSINLTRLVIDRMRRETERKASSRPVTFALLPVTPGLDLAALARRIAGELGPGVRLVTSAEVDGWFGEPGMAQVPHASERSARVAQRLEQLENEHPFVFYLTDPTPSEWTRRCLRHADRVLLLADARQDPQPGPLERDCLMDGAHAPLAQSYLVLMHPAGRQPPQGTSRWLAPRKLAGHLHLREDRPADWGRVARVVSGQATGLVLSGGGARGFAHLGVMKALAESGHTWDLVGGTSIGSVMGVFSAMDLSPDEAIAQAREAFRKNPTGDFNIFPVVSLIGGRRLRRIIDHGIHSVMGEGCGIEDLWKSFFCVSSNYSAARETVLTRGPLAKSLRASVAIPGALPPVMLDGQLHIDGATFNNFPTDVMAGMGASRIVGVNLLREGSIKYKMDELPTGWRLALDKLRGKRHRLPGIIPLLLNSSMMYSYARQGESKRFVDLYFNPPVQGYGIMEWTRFDSIVRAGYEDAMKRLEALAAQPQATE
ncbi:MULTISPECIES: patatin-like phospholipase family protein [Ramlibacter]|uniref:Patatin-like phospholipase family protein n=1 Tax=Ramlibacter aquaticus TaxID=2780094 RepID=A0ABR9SK43_9BURK|nr:MULTISPECIES: patatin-like phospholipase family protein [Ramlibacter]MBE7942736.1 patatin-like phospholipase family protein [Ramlibacter aquaticus]